MSHEKGFIFKFLYEMLISLFLSLFIKTVVIEYIHKTCLTYVDHLIHLLKCNQIEKNHFTVYEVQYFNPLRIL